jgi:putative Holliday junction resolvase
MGRIIAIDYGLKRSGLAVTDPEQRIATGLTSLKTSTLMDFLAKYIKEQPVESIVVGEPRHRDNTPSGPAPALARFIETLRRTFAQPVFLMDERFTSSMAAQSLVQSGVKKSKRRDKGLVDEVSAVLILQFFMEKQVIDKSRHSSG